MNLNLHNLGHALSGVGNWLAIGGPSLWITVDAVDKTVMAIITFTGLGLYAVGKGLLIYTGEPGNDTPPTAPVAPAPAPTTTTETKTN